MDQNKYPRNPILLIDDESSILRSFEITLKSSGLNNLISCTDSREVMGIIEKSRIDLVLLDLNMPYIPGQELLKIIKEEYPNLPVIVVSAVDDVTTAVKCMAEGACDYIIKPVDRNRFITNIKNQLQLGKLSRENAMLKNYMTTQKLNNPEAFAAIRTRNRKMMGIFRYIEAIRFSGEPILITGETGTGKELFAKAVHNSRTPGKPFVAVNVAGLDDNMFSDVLFGHEKGAFTDAHKKREGLIEKAKDGTLFLDEIGDLSIPSQVKLLRLLQEKEYYQLGTDTPKYSNAKIVVATHKNFKKATKEGTFREDLYYRLMTHQVEIPSLSKRADDIPLLLEHFLDEAAKVFKKARPNVNKELYTILSRYSFPGNIRELRALVFDVLSTSETDTLEPDFFINYINNRADGELEGESDIPFGGDEDMAIFFSSKMPTLKEAVVLTVKEALKRTNGNQSMAANLLGTTRQALNHRIKQMKKDEESSEEKLER